MDWTITVLRSARGEALFDDMVRRGLLEIRSMDEFEQSMKVMIRLTKKQRERVPVPPGRDAALRAAGGLSDRAGRRDPLAGRFSARRSLAFVKVAGAPTRAPRQPQGTRRDGVGREREEGAREHRQLLFAPDQLHAGPHPSPAAANAAK